MEQKFRLKDSRPVPQAILGLWIKRVFLFFSPCSRFTQVDTESETMTTDRPAQVGNILEGDTGKC